MAIIQKRLDLSSLNLFRFFCVLVLRCLIVPRKTQTLKTLKFSVLVCFTQNAWFILLQKPRLWALAVKSYSLRRKCEDRKAYSDADIGDSNACFIVSDFLSSLLSDIWSAWKGGLVLFWNCSFLYLNHKYYGFVHSLVLLSILVDHLPAV